MKLAFIDLETCGTDVEKHGVHQIAMILRTPDETVEFNWKVRPRTGSVADDDALALGRVTREELREYPEMRGVFREIVAVLDSRCDRFAKQDKFWFVGYNSPFDYQFLRRFWTDNNDDYFGSYFFHPPLDVMGLAGVELMSARTGMVNFKLLTVAKQLGFEVNEDEAHDALYDIRLTMQMFDALTADKTEAATA